MSARWSSSELVRACSGGMYAGVPAAIVNPLAATVSFASPKSASTITVSSGVGAVRSTSCRRAERNSTLLGFRSRWITPKSWTTDRHAASSTPIAVTSSMPKWRARARRCSIRSARVPRSACVITNAGCPPSSSVTAKTLMIRSWSIRRRIFASSMNRRRTSSLRAQLSASTLIATSASRNSSRANQTVANAPAPRVRTNR